MPTRRRRFAPLRLLTLAAAGAAGAGCDDPLAVGGLTVDSTVVRSDTVDPDPARSWEADAVDVVPGERLAGLSRAGLPVEVAWRPVDYRCEDVRGARLTVQLKWPDARMAAHGFSPGTGRLRCSETLVRYVVHPSGG